MIPGVEAPGYPAEVRDCLVSEEAAVSTSGAVPWTGSFNLPKVDRFRPPAFAATLSAGLNRLEIALASMLVCEEGKRAKGGD